MYNESVVRTEFGPVRGMVRDGVHTFKGIRYGADTAGYRFLPPRDPEPWSDVANAFAFGPTCPQDHPDTGIDRALNPFLQKIGLTDNLPESEDCLFLNVWTPGTAEAGRPVLVWVHSGAFATNSGSSPSIDGARLAAEGDVVVITFNHRLNVLGYTHLSDDPGSPFRGSDNAGMLDIVAVLRWVQRNVAAFGGDPDQVTLFGQSGGAMKISALLRMPAARGLFHRAILQSGATPRGTTAAHATEMTRRLAGHLGLDRIDPEALQTVPLTDLMRAYHALMASFGMGAFGAVEDGIVLPAEPVGPGNPGAGVPVIIGDLDTEATLFLGFGLPAIANLSREEVVVRVQRALGDAAASERLVAVVEREHPGASPYEVLARIASGGVFTLNARSLADALATADAAPVWKYRITWRTPVDDGLLFSPHELDVALTFGNVAAAAGLNGATAQAHELSDTIRAAWLAFARTGTPTSAGLAWPQYTAAARHTLTLGPAPGVAADLDRAELDELAAAAPPGVDWLAAVLQP